MQCGSSTNLVRTLPFLLRVGCNPVRNLIRPRVEGSCCCRDMWPSEYGSDVPLSLHVGPSNKVTATRELTVSQTDWQSAWFVISVHKISNIIFIQPLRTPVEKFKFLLVFNCNHFQLWEDSIFIICWVILTPNVLRNCTVLNSKPLTFLNVL